MELNSILLSVIDSYKNDVEKYQELNKYLLDELSNTQNKLKIANYRLDSIQHCLTSEVSSQRYGQITSNENE